MRSKAKLLSVSVFASVQIALGLLPLPAVASGPDPVTITKHANLGFTTSVPASIDTGVASPPCLLTVIVCLFHGAVAFNGTMNVAVRLATDVALTYDPSNLNTPNAPLPVSVRYTPTPNGSTVTYALTGTTTFQFDGCTNCPATLPFSANSAPISFTAPMDGDAPITIPGSSTGITLSVAGLDVITATLGSSLTLAPAAPGVFPGLGGAAALVQVTGASGAPVLPIEWDSAGSVQTFTLTTPPTPSAIAVHLTPLLHWVGTSGSAQINLHWTSDFQDLVAVIADIVSAGVCLIADCSISDPSPIVLFSGGLGPIYSSAGLDTTIGAAVGGVAGPLVAARVAAGFVPVPLTSPALASIPPITLGDLVLGIPAVSIAGVPAGVMLRGNAVHLTAAASGGAPPFTFAWTKDAAPFASTQAITDIPSLGNTTYAVTVTDSLGAVSNTASTTVRVYDFSVAGSPTTQQVLTTGFNTYAVTEALTAGSPASGLPTIFLSVSGLPAGTSPNFNPPSGSAGGFTSTLTITAFNAPAGTYTLTLTGTDSRLLIGGTRNATLTLQVLTPAQGIPNIIDAIDALNVAGVLNDGQTNALVKKLEHAIRSLTLRPDQPTACNQLQAFVNQVNAFLHAGILTPAQADTLLGGPLGILAIMAAIPC